mmetsp:Transcript_19084/g.44900  ORF Transcript_19084/g.44900 Transcript_19084/m.44900 type:complete len:200 (-) Transcript_19084:1137-1736(-)
MPCNASAGLSACVPWSTPPAWPCKPELCRMRGKTALRSSKLPKMTKSKTTGGMKTWWRSICMLMYARTKLMPYLSPGNRRKRSRMRKTSSGKQKEATAAELKQRYPLPCNSSIFVRATSTCNSASTKTKQNTMSPTTERRLLSSLVTNIAPLSSLASQSLSPKTARATWTTRVSMMSKPVLSSSTAAWYATYRSHTPRI